MNITSHAMLPALLALPFLPRSRPADFYRAAGAVALAGALPDLLTPHLSLAARYASWSHTVYAYAALDLVLIIAVVFGRRYVSLRIAMLASFGYALHLLGDAFAGGIVPFYPVSTLVVGQRLIPYRWWIAIDVVLFVASYFAFWWQPQYRWGWCRVTAAPAK